jgi:hypothetical protein
MFVYDHLGQFSFRIGPALAPPRPAEYLVRAYTYVAVIPNTTLETWRTFVVPTPATFQWIQMHQYDRSYPDSNYVGAYFDELCARGRALGPLIKSGNTVRNSPVIVRMFRNDEGTWVIQQECQK